MYEYKTIIYKEGSMNTMGSQNINPAKLDKFLNHYASQGWRLKEITKDNQKTFFGRREAYIIILERVAV
jgi:hypothetical protein